MPRLIHKTALASLLCTASVLVVIPLMFDSNAVAESVYMSNDDRRQLCVELGLTPEAMAALGIQGYQVSGIFSELDDQSALVSSMRSTQTLQQDALSSVKSLQQSSRQAGSRVEEQQIESQISQLETQISELQQSINMIRFQLRSAILPIGIDTEDVNRVCESIGLAALVPVEFRFANLLDEDFVEILNAIADEQQAAARDQQPDTETQLTLSRYRNITEVQLARSNLLYNLDAVRGAFNN